MGGNKVRTPSSRPQLFDQAQFSSSQQGIPVTLMAGERILPVKWISKVYGLRAVSAGGSKKSGGGSYNYYGSIVGCFGLGPFDELAAILENGAAAWPNAEPWVARSWASHSYVFYQGDFYYNTSGSATSNVPPAAPWQRFSLLSSSKNGDGYTQISVSYGGFNYGTIRFYWGGPGQTADGLLTNADVVGTEIHPPYQGCGLLVLDNYFFGEGTQDPPNLQVIVRRSPKQSLITGDAAGLNDGQANVVPLLAEALTDGEHGTGLDAGRLDATSWQATADALQAAPNIMLLSPFTDRLAAMRDLAQQATTHTDVWVRHNAQTNLVEAGQWKHGATPATYTTVTAAHLTQRPKVVEAGWADANTGCWVSYPDRARLFNDTPTQPVQDLRARTILGESRETEQQRPWITRAAQAAAHAQEWLRYNGRAPATVELKVRRPFALGTGLVGDAFRYGIRPGDWMLLDVDPEPGGTQRLQFCRVTERTIPRTGAVTIKAIADPTLTPIIYTPPPDSLQLNQPEAPADVVSARIIECPPALADGRIGMVIALAQRAEAKQVGMSILWNSTLDGDSNFEDLGQQRFFAVRASLAADLAVDALSDADELPIDGTPADSVLRLTVAAQVDDDLFSQAPPAIQAANDDTLLLVLVNTDGDFVAEDGEGNAELEVLSVVSWTAITDGFALDALRARRGTHKRAFTAATAEAWLIPRAMLNPVAHADFAALRQLRKDGGSPTTGTFLLQPFTVRTIRSEDDLTSITFRFPTSSPSQPNLSLEAPGETSFPYTFGTDAGGTLRLTGRFLDSDRNMTSLSVAVTAPDGTVTSLLNQALALSGEAPFDVSQNCNTSGTWRFTLTAVDADSLAAETVLEAVVPAAAGQVATPTASPPGASLGAYTGGLSVAVTLSCATAGATIYYRTDVLGGSGGGSWSTYTGPVTISRTGFGSGRRLFAYATHSGMADSVEGFWDFPYVGR